MRSSCSPHHSHLLTALGLVLLLCSSQGCGLFMGNEPPAVEAECIVDPTLGNGLDDDEDGVVDEGCACTFDGLDTGVCVDGRIDQNFQLCRRPLDHYPIEVILCDTLDNDCDGLADEQCKCEVNGNGAGVCALGRIMSDGMCLAPEFFEEDEILCDGYDNDCDNQTDENCTICDFQGILEGVCPYGRPDPGSGLCLPPLNFMLVEQECSSDPLAGDNVDNDCDGFIDEGCACPFNNSVRGVCSVGKRAAPGDCLEPDNYEADEVTCDGLDNDCDGQVDEGCSRTVIDNCEPSEEMCDGLDNDCDGITDEACTCNYAQNDRGVCRQGIRSSTSGLCTPPQAFEPLEVSCDGIDNDCNGQVDERCDKDLVQVSAGDAHTCGILEDGLARCWGRNAWNLHDVPQDVIFQKLDSGHFHTCGLSSDDRVYCWGGNDNGQAAAPDATAIDVATGGYHSCLIGPSGEANCWGSDLEGQSSPTGSNYTQLTAGEYHTCGLSSTGQVTCWGLDASGQASPPTDATFTQVIAGAYHTCGLSSTGQARCWGDDAKGQSSPPATGSYAELFASADYTCGLSVDGQLECWGEMPEQMTAPTPPMVTFAPGPKHACGLTQDKRLLCWGDNSFRQLAPDPNIYKTLSIGPTNSCAIQDSSLPLCWGNDTTGINATPNKTMFAISVGTTHACGIRSSNNAPECWGSGPASLMNPSKNLKLKQIAVSDQHACGIKLDGKLTCWGDNANNKLDAPEGTFIQLAVGPKFSCAIADNKSLTCWGEELGTNNLTPPRGLFQAIAVGPTNACTLSDRGTATCWGDETHNIHRTSRTIYSKIAVGERHACAITDRGELDCWGSPDQPGTLSVPTTDRFTHLTIGAHSGALSRDNHILSW